MASYPPPPPPPPGYGPGPNYASGSAYDRRAWKAQRRAAKVQARWMRDQYRMQRRSLRRCSIVGPMVLLVLGVVFLLGPAWVAFVEVEDERNSQDGDDGHEPIPVFAKERHHKREGLR